MKAASREPMIDRTAPHTKRAELPPRHDSVLPRGDLGDHPIG
jgi:hypothetical protein